MVELPEGFVDISVEQDGGILKKVVKEGTGAQCPACSVEVDVHYVGTIYGGDKDGEKFDSSRDRGDRFHFKIGEGSVIKAWDEGVATMKVGEISEFICAPNYAYGESGSGNAIPPNATLKFEVELFGWKGKDISPDNDSSILQTVLKKGQGYDHPKDCSTVDISVIGKCNNQVFDERRLQFRIGEAQDFDLPKGLELAVKKMNSAEKSMFDIAPLYGWGIRGCEKFKIPPNSFIQYTVELHSFEKLKEAYTIDSNEKRFEYANTYKQQGTEVLKSGKYSMASKFYKHAASLLEMEHNFTEKEDIEARSALLVALNSNMALCHLKLDENALAIEKCDEALKFESTNEKALFRRGQAFAARNDFEVAEECFQKVLKLDSTNKPAQQQIALCKAKLQKMKAQEKKLYQSMFAKMQFSEKPKSNGDNHLSETNGTHIETEPVA